jgi:hypothetical protein
MVQTKFKTPYLLSAFIAILAIIATAGGLFIGDLYQADTAWASSQQRGNDLVTLVVAVPLLAGGLLLSRRGSPRAQLIWLGMIGYMLYNYMFYLFGTAFNRFFLIYVALFSLSLFALIFALVSVDAEDISRRFRPRTPVRWISGYLLFIALFLGGMWISRSLGFVTSGQLPQDIVDSGIHTSVVYAIDLSLLAPSLVLGALWLWQRRPWGFVLGTILIIKCTAYPLALIAMGVFMANAGVAGDYALMPFWILFAIASLIASGFLLGNLRAEEKRGGSLKLEGDVPSVRLKHAV